VLEEVWHNLRGTDRTDRHSHPPRFISISLTHNPHTTWLPLCGGAGQDSRLYVSHRCALCCNVFRREFLGKILPLPAVFETPLLVIAQDSRP